MNKPTYEELERSLVILSVSGFIATVGEENVQEPAKAFFRGLTDDDLKKVAETVNAALPKFFTVEVPQ